MIAEYTCSERNIYTQDPRSILVNIKAVKDGNLRERKVLVLKATKYVATNIHLSNLSSTVMKMI